MKTQMMLFIGFTAFTATAFGAAPSREALPGSKPNVVVILCDDLGYGDLGCFGHPAIRTPHLDRMAREGVRLTACYSAAPVCSSSRAGLMTGRMPSRSGVYDWIPAGHPMHLRTSEVTIASLLKQGGYDTCHSGKWHLNGEFNKSSQPQPGDHGFDHWYSTQNNAAPSHENPRNFVRNGEEVGPQEGFSCQLVVDEAIDWLDRRDAAEKPFFMFVCFHEPHEPVASPADLVKTYLDEEGPKARNEDEAQYFANVTNVDLAVGRLLDTLKDRGIDEKTLVVFTSDNGPETLDRYAKANRSYGSPGPLRGMKLWLYEAGLRVPGIVRWPGVIEAGQESDVPVCSVDLLPTVCELAGVDAPKDRTLDGTSLVPMLAGKSFERTKPLVWDYFFALDGPKAAMRIDDHVLVGKRTSPDKVPNATGGNVNPASMKAIKAEEIGKFELYNLRSDLSQEHDLATQEADFVRKYSPLLVERHREVRDEGPAWKFSKKK